jgi:hypothetical protein
MKFTHSEKKLKKSYFSSYKLPKLKLTNFWSQGILVINVQAMDHVPEAYFLLMATIDLASH